MLKKFMVKVNGVSYDVEVQELGNDQQTQNVQPTQSQTQVQVAKPVETKPVEVKKTPEPIKESSPSASGGNNLLAPLPGTILDVFIKEGDKVNKGDKIVVIEAMKMENEIPSEFSGVVSKVYVKKGDTVDGDQLICTIS